ncbi:MAG TPA: FtsX-like permease family protein [Thermoanaerobaculia bacterium]|nr:FtsX-like permease family protein [Thermoanaerobaculia bacterium]
MSEAGTRLVISALILRPIVRETIRTLLTILGIAVGVAVVVAIELSNQSALRAFGESVDAIAGRANYQIVSEAVPIPEDVLIRLQPLWRRGVRFAPIIDIEGVIEPDQTPIRLLGVDLLSDLHFRDYRYATVMTSATERPQSRADDEPANARMISTWLDLFRDDSIVVAASFAHEHRLALGSVLRIDVLGHERRMTIRGILEPRGPATAFNGSIAVADIAAAQTSFGLTGKLTRIDLLVPDASADELLREVRRVIPAGARVERPSQRNERVAKMLRAFRINLFALAGVALLVGMFLVYNTVLISILRRRRDVGIFKTLGVSPRQIFLAFLSEGLVFGLIGSAAGIALGDALASAILRLIGRTINSLYVTSSPEAIVLKPAIIALGATVGTLLSLVSAIQPSLEAARVRPIVLIQPGLHQRVGRKNNRALALASIACFAAGTLVSFIPPYRGIAVAGYVGVLFIVAGFSLPAPMIVTAVSHGLAPLLRRIFGVVGQLAPASLPASLRRTAVASAALSLATGMMVAVALMVGSFRETVRIWVDQTVGSDLWLRPSRGLTNAQIALFPESISADLAKVGFIAAFDRVRGKDIAYGESIIAVGSGDFPVTGGFGVLPMVKPRSAAAALARALAIDGVFISESFAIKFDKDVGDSVVLPTAHGMRGFPITGIYRDYSNDRGVVVMDRSLYIRSFEDHAINTVAIFLKPGVDPEWARVELEHRFGPSYHAFAITNRSIRREVMTIFDQTFLITYALLGVAIAVAVLGIVNTLAALILERARELALLRVLGLSAAELRRMLVLESSLLGLVSTAVGLVMGYVLSFELIYVINKQSFGWTIDFHTPAALIAISLAVTFLSASVAGFIPARLAARIDLASAIKAE